MMRRVVRLLVYTGNHDDVETALSRSMPDGVRGGGNTVSIRAITITDAVLDALLGTATFAGPIGQVDGTEDSCSRS